MKFGPEIQAASAKLPGALGKARALAVEHFLETGFPTTRMEDWKYTSLEAAASITAEAVGASDSPSPIEVTPPEDIEAHWLVIANGVPSATEEIPGVQVTPLSEAETRLRYDLPLSDLNLALLNDGLHIRVTRKAKLAKPIGLLFNDRADSGSLMTQGRVQIVVDERAEASFVEFHASQGAGNVYSNCLVEMSVGNAASVDYTRLQLRDEKHVHTSQLIVDMAKDSTLRHFALDTGGRVVRNDLRLSIDKPGAHVAFDGVYLSDRGQHIDNHTRVDHRVGPATSRQEYRGIVRGRSVWNGKAIVHEGADGTDAVQANHNLLIDERADVNAKPELEIYADDVKCAHGTTVGQLDETALFYLRSRGIPEIEARQMLIAGFTLGLLDNNPVAACEARLQVEIEQKLHRMVPKDQS